MQLAHVLRIGEAVASPPQDSEMDVSRVEQWSLLGRQIAFDVYRWTSLILTWSNIKTFHILLTSD